jgi:predicted RNA-binding Zn ribbon-like protein
VELIANHVVRRDQPLAVELVSTVHVGDGEVVDALASPDGLGDWLAVNAARLGDAGTVDPGAALPPVRALRAAVERLLRAAIAGDPPDPDDVEAVNAATRAAPSHRELCWSHGDASPVAVDRSPADVTGRLLALLAYDAVATLAGEHGPLGACGGPGCVLLFARSHPRQAWCSNTCGNRARVARHYRRTRQPRVVPSGATTPACSM